MTDKKPPLALQPAPRPRLRLSADEILSVTTGAADLGFNRPLAAGKASHREPDDDAPPAPIYRSAKGPVGGLGRQPPAPVMMVGGLDEALLKLRIPAALSETLKHEAIRRRVTLRYLVLEALANAGYPVNMAAIPEDGRRLR